MLTPKHFSAGLNPVIEDNSFGMYLFGGYGIRNNVDFNVRYRYLKASNYLGANLKWGLKKTGKVNISLMTGAHYASYVGLDIGLSACFPVNNSLLIFTGLDSDINFNINFERFFWLPLGIEMNLSPMVSIIVEADVPLVEFAPGVFSGGVLIYIN
jgi:hypothetical protein